MAVGLTELRSIALVNTLRSCQLFTGLPLTDLEKIAAITTVKSLDKGEYLFHEGDPARGLALLQGQPALALRMLGSVVRTRTVTILSPARLSALLRRNLGE
jgi:hypothetical protein